MKKSTLLSIFLFTGALPVSADELVRLGVCQYADQAGNLCQLFEKGTEVGSGTSVTGISLSEATILNPGLEEYLEADHALVHLVLQVDGSLITTDNEPFAKKLTEIRFAEDRPLQHFIFNQEVDNFPRMTEEELRKWNPQFADAPLDTIVPAWTVIWYSQN